jgi:acetyl esterase/lipase
MLLSAAALDPFLDDSLLLHLRSRLAGVASHLVVYRDNLHGFDMLCPDSPEALWHWKLTSSFIAACINSEPAL